MPDGDREMAQEIFTAMLAAARGDDRTAGELLRGVFGRISSQLFQAAPGAAFRGPMAAPGKATMPDLGEQEEEG